MMRTTAHPSLGEVVISQSRRAKRISVTVNRLGIVRLSYPVGCPHRTAWDFMEANVDKIGAIRAGILAKRQSENRNIIEPPYSTLRHELVFVPCTIDRITAKVADGKVAVRFPENLPHDDQQLQDFIRKALARALCIEGKEILPPIVKRLAAVHGFDYRSVTVRATTSRWGSCSHRNDISLSAYLVRLPIRLIEFIVLHELCHTRHKDHSSAFHTLLDSLMNGEEKNLNRELKKYRTGF